MCKFWSCIVTTDKEVLSLDTSSSHDDIVTHFKLPTRREKFARVELVPPGFDYFAPARDWVFKLDEMRRPDWFSPAHEEACFATLEHYLLARRFVNQKFEQLPAGINGFLLKDVELGTLCGDQVVQVLAGSSKIHNMLDQSQVHKMWDQSQVRSMWNQSWVYEVRDQSQVCSMLDQSQVREILDQSQVREMRGQSQVREMRGQSQVREMLDQSQVRSMWGQSQVREMRDQSQVHNMWGQSQVRSMWDQSQVRSMRDQSQVREMRGQTVCTAYNRYRPWMMGNAVLIDRSGDDVNTLHAGGLK